MARCSACHTLVGVADPSETCPECRQTYHAACWRDLGGCATYGCPKAAEARKPDPPQVVGQGWGDTKSCPACDATIGSGLLVCRCGAEFPYADPLTRAEYHAWRRHNDETRNVRRGLLALFLLSLTGLLAPFAGAAAAWLAWTHRERLEGADGTYLAMGYGAAALGATHTLVALLLLIGL